jgi:hypothetical protein
MKKILIVLTTLMITLFIASTSASALNITKGYKQVGLSGWLDFETADGAEIILRGSYGYFIRNSLLVGGGLYFETDKNEDMYFPEAFIERLFPVGSPWVPFVGGAVGFYSYSDDSRDDDEYEDSATIITGYGGVKYFVNEGTALQGRLIYKYATEDIYLTEDDDDNDGYYDQTNSELVTHIGIVFYF